MRVGFIGLGNMGGPMTLNMIKAGHSLTVYDVRREAAEPHLAAGAQWADSPAAVVAQSEVVVTSLPGPKDVESVATGEGGILSKLARGAVYADLSTNSPTLIRQLHGAFQAKGMHLLDAPVSGGIPGARNATLAVMVGGSRNAFERIKPVLDAIGDKVSYIGDSGAGAVAKLVHNMIAICSTQLLAEAFTMGVKAGVSPEALLNRRGCCSAAPCPRWFSAVTSIELPLHSSWRARTWALPPRWAASSMYRCRSRASSSRTFCQLSRTALARRTRPPRSRFRKIART